MKTPVSATDKPNWREVIAHRPDVYIFGVEAFENNLVLLERKDGFRQIRAGPKINPASSKFHDGLFFPVVYHQIGRCRGNGILNQKGRDLHNVVRLDPCAMVCQKVHGPTMVYPHPDFIQYPQNRMMNTLYLTVVQQPEPGSATI